MTLRRRTLPSLAALLALTASGLQGQLVTERPSFVESSTVVGSGVFQLETSVAFADVSGGHVYTTPTLVRIGLGSRWEFRVESPFLTSSTFDGGDGESGVSDVALGVKAHLQDAEGNRPSSGLLLHVTFASGSEAFRGRGARPSLRLATEWALSDGVGLGIMPGIAIDRDDEGGFASGILGVIVGWGWTDVLSSYAEVAFSQIASDERGGVTSTFDAGAALLLTPDHQLDLGVVLPLSDSADDFAVTLGFSVRAGG